mgnify:CR=1 FL=1
MNQAINKAIARTQSDGITRYIFSTYAKIVISFNPAPFGKHCWKVDSTGFVIEIKERVYG